MIKRENKTNIQKEISDMLEGRFESPDDAFSISASRFTRFVYSEKRKERYIAPYGLSKEELFKEGEELIDKYIDLMVAEHKDDYTNLLYELCYPIYLYSNKRGYEILCSKK